MTQHPDTDFEIQSFKQHFKIMHDIDIDDEQAVKVIIYEKERDAGTDIFFSPWEELDFEFVSFREILTPAQFEKYKSDVPRRLQEIGKGYIECDKSNLPYLKAAEERLEYYKNVFIPAVRKNLMMVLPIINFQKGKIDFLKATYLKYSSVCNQ